MTRTILFHQFLTTIVLAASVLTMSGCCLIVGSSDAELSDNLILWLRVSNGHFTSDSISFEMFYNSADEAVCLLGWRRVVVTANGNPLTSPRSWSLGERIRPVYRETRQGYRGCLLWHMSPTEVIAWLGGPGRYSIQVSIGPVNSNSVVVECMSDNRIEIINAGEAPHGARTLSPGLTHH